MKTKSLFSDIRKIFDQIYSGKGQNLFSDLNMPNAHILQKTFEYAEKAHQEQRRKGLLNRPYSDHLLSVWYLVYLSGGTLEEQQAALLHDVAEDCQKEMNMTSHEIVIDIALNFSPDIAEIVKELTLPFEDSDENDETELKLISQLTPSAKLVKACDNMSNLWDAVFDRPEYWDHKRFLYVVEFRQKVMRLTQNSRTNWLNGIFTETLKAANFSKLKEERTEPLSLSLKRRLRHKL